MEASANVTREEFNTAIGDISAKMETLMTTMSQLVQGAAPTAGGGRESRGGRHTAPGSDQGGLDHAPNTREAPSWQRHRAASSVGDASRESAHVRDPKTATFLGAFRFFFKLLSQKSLETEGIMRVLRTRAGHLKVGVEDRGKRGKPEHAFAAMGGKGEVKQTRRKKKKPQRDDPDTALIAGSDAKCYVCGDKGHFIQQCPKQTCQKCGVKGHHIRKCKVEFVGAMVVE